MDCAGAGPPRVVSVSAYDKISGSVPVQIAQQRHGSAESVAGGKLWAVGRRAVDLHCALYGAVRVEEQYVNGARLRRAVHWQPHCNVGRPVAVQIADGRDRRAEQAAPCKLRAVGRR